MDTQTFNAAIASMRLFPGAIIDAALKAGDIMNDAQRAGLYTELRGVYGEYEELEERRRILLQQAIAEINAWRKTELPKLHAAIEEEERQDVMQKLETQMA